MAKTRVLQGFLGAMQPLGSIKTGDAVHHSARSAVQTVLATSGAENPLRPILQTNRYGMAPGSISIVAKRAVPWFRGDGIRIPMSQYIGPAASPGKKSNKDALTAAQSVVKNAATAFATSKGKVHGFIIGDGGVQISKWNATVQALGRHRKKTT